jgi:uncharacterized protein (DUF488 family)
MSQILTIGASTHSSEALVALLKQHRVSAVADVRSVPASRFTPQFNRANLQRTLREVNIRYVFLGKELGARSQDPTCYINGKVQYARLAQTSEFHEGVRRLETGAARERIAILCTEQEPLDCHRTVLVARVLAEQGMDVRHIHGDGSLETHDEAMRRLCVGYGLDQPTLLDSEDELLRKALALQEAKIAYVDADLAVG